ncbi:MAG: ABC transporter permease [Chloroflexota bacterium]
MTGYILRRLVHMVPVLLLITLFTFLLIRLVPGDPARVMLGPRATPERVAEIRRSLGLDKPLWTQYVIFLKNLLRGDLGDSIRKREPVVDVVLVRIPPTLFLSVYALILACLITVPLATWAALNQGKWPDQLVRVFVLASLAMPAYWVGMMLLQFFAVRFRVFPVAGWGEGFLSHLESLFLPALSLALAIASLLVRSLRNAILETLSADYVRTARAKGLAGRQVLLWHVLRNSSLSTVTILGVNLAFLLGGTTIVETIFAIPGLGQLIVRAIFDRDYPVIQGITLTIGILVLLINLATDLLYAVLDPRVKLE